MLFIICHKIDVLLGGREMLLVLCVDRLIYNRHWRELRGNDIHNAAQQNLEGCSLLCHSVAQDTFSIILILTAVWKTECEKEVNTLTEPLYKVHSWPIFRLPCEKMLAENRYRSCVLAEYRTSGHFISKEHNLDWEQNLLSSHLLLVVYHFSYTSTCFYTNIH